MTVGMLKSRPSRLHVLRVLLSTNGLFGSQGSLPTVNLDASQRAEKYASSPSDIQVGSQRQCSVYYVSLFAIDFWRLLIQICFFPNYSIDSTAFYCPC